MLTFIVTLTFIHMYFHMYADMCMDFFDTHFMFISLFVLIFIHIGIHARICIQFKPISMLTSMFVFAFASVIYKYNLTLTWANPRE